MTLSSTEITKGEMYTHNIVCLALRKEPEPACEIFHRIKPETPFLVVDVVQDKEVRGASWVHVLTPTPEAGWVCVATSVKVFMPHLPSSQNN